MTWLAGSGQLTLACMAASDGRLAAVSVGGRSHLRAESNRNGRTIFSTSANAERDGPTAQVRMRTPHAREEGTLLCVWVGR